MSNEFLGRKFFFYKFTTYIDMKTIAFEGKKYQPAAKFTDGCVCISKDGKSIIRLDGVLGRENWIPLEEVI